MVSFSWWQTAVFYQVYPRSFADGNGDGIGDLVGLIAKLDYLQDLGITAIWLSPHYPSPQVDCGYDISDYCNVNPDYGTLQDFQRFLDEAHQRSLKVVTDLVLNHTSDQHSWFLESRSSKKNPKRDWYIWHTGKRISPPNNWLSAFGGSAWEYDPSTQEYYYHLFFKEQPDLNWRTPAVKEALWAAARFWLDLGVDGFRLDAIDTLYEHPDLPDHPVAQSQADLHHYLLSASSEERKLHGDQTRIFQYQVNQPGAVELMRELRLLINEYEDRVLIGESDRMNFYGNGKDCLHMVFNFPLMNMGELKPLKVLENQAHRLSAIPPGGWPANTLGNHDRPRTIQAHSDGKHDQELARVSLAMLLTLPGTPFLYYGEEIGMTNFYLNNLKLVRDRVSNWVYQAALERQITPERALDLAVLRGRDRCRTPMQWTGASNAGFSPSGVATWLPVNPNYSLGVNAADQENNPDSLLNYYRRLLNLRQSSFTLQVGDFKAIHLQNTNVLAYQRQLEGYSTVIVLLNFSENAHPLTITTFLSAAHCIFSNYHQKGTTYNLAEFSLSPFEVFIAECSLQV